MIDLNLAHDELANEGPYSLISDDAMTYLTRSVAAYQLVAEYSGEPQTAIQILKTANTFRQIALSLAASVEDDQLLNQIKEVAQEWELKAEQALLGEELIDEDSQLLSEVTNEQTNEQEQTEQQESAPVSENGEKGNDSTSNS
jgi:hypothetical protein